MRGFNRRLIGDEKGVLWGEGGGELRDGVTATASSGSHLHAVLCLYYRMLKVDAAYAVHATLLLVLLLLLQL
jgi:hypothetical protein